LIRFVIFVAVLLPLSLAANTHPAVEHHKPHWTDSHKPHETISRKPHQAASHPKPQKPPKRKAGVKVKLPKVAKKH